MVDLKLNYAEGSAAYLSVDLGDGGDKMVELVDTGLMYTREGSDDCFMDTTCAPEPSELARILATTEDAVNQIIEEYAFVIFYY